MNKKLVFFHFNIMLFVTFLKTAHAEPVTAALITGGAALGGSGISALMQWYGMKAQERENRRAEAIGNRERKQDIARSEKWNKKQFGLQEKQFGASQAQRKFNNMMTVTNRLWAQLSAKPQMEANLINIWRGRRAA